MRSRTLSRYTWKSWFAPWPQADWLLMLLVVGLTTFGGLMIFSTQLNEPVNHGWQHWITGGLGLGLALMIARWRYDVLIQWHWLTYAITNLSLIAVMVIGATAKGAQRWISIGGFNVQPSEFAKIAVIITLAALLHNHPPKTFQGIFRILAITGIPWLLVFLQPDLGTSLVFGFVTLAMLYWSNVNPGWLILMLSPLVSAILFNLYFEGWVLWAIAMTVIAWVTLPWRFVWWRGLATLTTLLLNFAMGKMGELAWGLLKDYQKSRLTVFLDPEKDVLGGGYQLIQSKTAIGAGKMWGVGLHQGTQTQLNFVPEQHTDFIFSAVGEEWGFVGSIILLIGFWVICLRLVLIACHAKENFGSLLAIGVLAMIAFQVIVNIGMNIGLAPVTGIPLPWMSYGRSAMLTNFIAIGLVESVANFRPRPRII
jgi:rod shape determining protein RodA